MGSNSYLQELTSHEKCIRFRDGLISVQMKVDGGNALKQTHIIYTGLRPAAAVFIILFSPVTKLRYLVSQYFD